MGPEIPGDAYFPQALYLLARRDIEFAGIQYAKRQCSPREAQKLGVFRDQYVRARRQRKLKELLVVAVAALRQPGVVSWRLPPFPGDFSKLRQALLLARRIERPFAQRIGEHAGELGFAGGIDDDLEPACRLRGAQARGAWVAEHQPVEPDVGVEDRLEPGYGSPSTAANTTYSARA
jgi:hypothetical protein